MTKSHSYGTAAQTWLDVLYLPHKTPVADVVAYIETAAKEQLRHLGQGEEWSTTELANALWHPDDTFPDNPGVDTYVVRKRLFTFLGHVKDGQPTLLPQWRKRGYGRKLHGKVIQPWIWFNPLHENVIESDRNYTALKESSQA